MFDVLALHLVVFLLGMVFGRLLELAFQPDIVLR
jgi:hypothetical protein